MREIIPPKLHKNTNKHDSLEDEDVSPFKHDYFGYLSHRVHVLYIYIYLPTFNVVVFYGINLM